MATNPARAGVTWTGLDELAAALRNFPEAVTSEAAPIVGVAAREHFAAMAGQFPEPGHDVTGNLRKANVLVQESALVWRVRNKAPHSHLYEKGFSHVSDKQVAGHDVWVPAAQDIRARMVSQLREVMDRVAARSGAFTKV